MTTPKECTHNEMIANPNSVADGNAWKCADCGYVYGLDQWFVWHDPDGQTFFASQDYKDVLAKIGGYEAEPQIVVQAKHMSHALGIAISLFDQARSEGRTP